MSDDERDDERDITNLTPEASLTSEDTAFSEDAFKVLGWLRKKHPKRVAMSLTVFSEDGSPLSAFAVHPDHTVFVPIMNVLSDQYASSVLKGVAALLDLTSKDAN